MAGYVQVEPREHDGGCRSYGPDAKPPSMLNIRPALDTENCERCRGLWWRLEEVHQRRIGREVG